MDLLAQQRQFLERVLQADSELKQLGLKHQERMSVYSNGYHLRIAEAMQSDFPMLLKWMSEDPFNAMVRDYLQRYPSQDYTIHNVGQRLPDYLTQQQACHPLLAELAHLEWLQSTALLAQNTALLTLDQCAAFSEEKWLTLHLQLHPSVQVFHYQYRVIRFWTALNKKESWGADPKDWQLLPSPSCCLIWRDPNDQSCLCELKQEEIHLFELLCRKLNFTELCEALVTTLGEQGCKDLAETTLWRWVEQGLFRIER